MQAFQDNPGFVFPFDIKGCDRLTNRASCELHAGPRAANGLGVVDVATTDTGALFTVVSDGYFDERGSTIEFSTFEKDGEVYLQQHAETFGYENTCRCWGRPRVYSRGMEQSGAQLASAASNFAE